MVRSQTLLLKALALYWLVYRHNNQISVVIEPGAPLIHASILPPAKRIELVTNGIGGAAWKKQVSSRLHTNVHERGLNFQIRFCQSRAQLKCLQVAFSRFANVLCCRFHLLIFTLRFIPAPSASEGKGQEDQGDDRIAGPHFPSQGLVFNSIDLQVTGPIHMAACGAVSRYYVFDGPVL